MLKDLIKKRTHEDENENYYNNCFYFEEGKKIGFIGAGNMATAIVKGLLKAEVPQECICVYDCNVKQLKHMASNVMDI